MLSLRYVQGSCSSFQASYMLHSDCPPSRLITSQPHLKGQESDAGHLDKGTGGLDEGHGQRQEQRKVQPRREAKQTADERG